MKGNKRFKQKVVLLMSSIGVMILIGLILIWSVYPYTKQVMFARPISTEELFALAVKHKVGIITLYTSYRLGTETFTEIKLLSPDEAYSVNEFNHEQFRQDLIDSRQRAMESLQREREQVLYPIDEGTRSEQWQIDLENWYTQIDSPSRSINDFRATGVVVIGQHWRIRSLLNDLLPITGILADLQR